MVGKADVLEEGREESVYTILLAAVCDQGYTSNQHNTRLYRINLLATFSGFTSCVCKLKYFQDHVLYTIKLWIYP